MAEEENESTKHGEETSLPGWASRRKLTFVLIAMVTFILISWALPIDPPEGSTETQVRTGLAILALAAILWLTEAIPLAVTALLIPVLAVLSGVFVGDPATIVPQAFSGFAHHLIFLFLGGFGIAAALTRE